MELAEMIEKGTKTAGSQKELAVKLGVHANSLSNAKKGDRGLPDDACMRLAELIEAPLGAVIAARNYALAKDESQKKFWLPYVKSDWRRGRDSNPCAKFP